MNNIIMPLTRRSRSFRNKLVYSLTAVALLFLVFLITDKGHTLHVIKSEYFRCIHGYIGSDTDISAYARDRVQACEGHFVGYGNQFAVLNNVVVSDDIKTFSLPCTSNVQYHFNYGKEGTHMNNWLKRIVHISNSELEKLKLRKPAQGNISRAIDKCAGKPYVILVQRYEYANLYHTMTDWYNVFLVTKLLNISLNDVCVLLSGSNKQGILDSVWKSLFIDLAYTSEISSPILIHKLVWSIIGYESPLNYHSRKTVPFLEEYRNFFLSQHSVTGGKVLNCNKLKILFLVRKDYVSHPGNKEGIIKRKILNMQEVLVTLKSTIPSADVIAEQLDQLAFADQVKIISETDIVISMHGAGLSHVLFLPSHAGVFELYPLYWKKSLFFNHFQMFAKWRGLQYTYWQNSNQKNEHNNFHTYVPPVVIKDHVNELYSKICGK